VFSPKHPSYILDFCQTLVVRLPEIAIPGYAESPSDKKLSSVVTVYVKP